MKKTTAKFREKMMDREIFCLAKFRAECKTKQNAEENTNLNRKKKVMWCQLYGARFNAN